MEQAILGLIGTANLATLGLIVKIYFMMGGVISNQKNIERRINILEKKYV